MEIYLWRQLACHGQKVPIRAEPDLGSAGSGWTGRLQWQHWQLRPLAGLFPTGLPDSERTLCLHVTGEHLVKGSVSDYNVGSACGLADPEG